MGSMFCMFPPYVYNMNIDDSNRYLKKLPAKWSKIHRPRTRRATSTARVSPFATVFTRVLGSLLCSYNITLYQYYFKDVLFGRRVRNSVQIPHITCTAVVGLSLAD